jgi:hypothetical protein
MIRGLFVRFQGFHPMAWRSCVLGLLTAAAAGGCAGYHPRLWQPGTIQQQRLRATVHDPYPDPDLGPEIDGGRPREYQEPLPEPVRNRLFVDSWWR